MNRLYRLISVLLILAYLPLQAQSVIFNNPYDHLHWTLNLSIAGGITGNDGTGNRLTLYHGSSIALQTGENSVTRIDGQNTRMFINGSGQVGIGTINPIIYSRLHVEGAGGITTSGSGAEFRFRDQTSPPRPDPWLDEWSWSARDNIGRFSKVGLSADIFKFDQYGSVGIFTTGLPEARLDVNGVTKTNYLTVRSQDGAAEGGEISLAGSVGSPSWQMDVFNNTLRVHTNGTLPFQIFPNGNLFTPGNIGIGIGNPTERLEIGGALKTTYGRFSTIYSTNSDGIYPPGYVNVLGDSQLTIGANWTGGATDLSLINSNIGTGTTSGGGFSFWQMTGASSKKMLAYIRGDGSMGIGTTTPGDYKLAVEGKIGAREVEVKVGSWADFVFKKSYVLPSLKEVEEHILKKQHLPGIPSEAEVKEKGYALGAMDAKLLQKVEELTLYVIEQQKQINGQQKQIDQLMRLLNRQKETEPK